MEREKIVNRVGNYLCMLLILLFVADPTNSILHLKNPVFVLLMLYNICFFKPDFSKFIYPLIPFITILVSWLFTTMRGQVMDFDTLKAVFTSFAILFFLPWSHHYDIIKLAKLPVLVTALLTILLFWLIAFFPFMESAIYGFMSSHEGTIMMSRRSFLGISMFGMYYKSTAAFFVVFGVALYNTIHKEKRTFIDVLLTFSLLHLFLISGTRSSMLLPMLLAGVICFIFLRNKRYLNYIIYPAVLLFVVAFFALLAMLLMESNEPSNIVKYAHLTSYKNLFINNPLYLFVGQGPGTYFYSLGFHRMTMITEWTYLELLRNYGILFSAPILYVILSPLFALLKMVNRDEMALVISLSYTLYLIIAGTNPLLISSTGMLVLLFVYNYRERNM